MKNYQSPVCTVMQLGEDLVRTSAVTTPWDDFENDQTPASFSVD